MVQAILDVAPLTVDALADDAGISRHTLYAWAAGRRNPSPDNVARLAKALRARGGRLLELAEALEREVEG